MVNAPVRGGMLLAVLVLACAGGEELTADSRPITAMPVSVTDTTTDSEGSSGSSTGTDSSGGEVGTTTATPMTEASGGSCPDGTLFCPCPGGCDDGLSCVDGLCQLPGCGNGVVEAPEECDDGDEDQTDECLIGCKSASCGDGFRHFGVELCDEGLANSDTGKCKLNCTLQTCGDGLVGPGENCDDGNDVNADMCSNACAPPGCGDMVVNAPEACDDGNASNTDACLPSCVAASCGDGIVQIGVEDCDDGNASNTDACLVGCVPATCGDGVVQAGVEACDDGNVNPNDGCDVLCNRIGTLVGAYDVHDGLPWGEDPPTFTCKEACAQIFGGEVTDYACSTSDQSITGTAYLSGWGDAQYCGTPTDDDYKMNTNYNCGGVGCAYSAYVKDHCADGTSINYCWKP